MGCPARTKTSSTPICSASSRREGSPLGTVLRRAEAADEGRQLRVSEQLSDGLRLAEVEPVVIGRAVQPRDRSLAGGVALPAPGEPINRQRVEVRISGLDAGETPSPIL